MTTKDKWRDAFSEPSFAYLFGHLKDRWPDSVKVEALGTTLTALSKDLWTTLEVGDV